MDRVGRARPRKKLKEAAAYWVRGGDGYDQARADLRAFGASAEQIALQLGSEESPGFEIWPGNAAVFSAFLTVQTQWASGSAGPTGLDYTRVRDGLELAGIDLTPEIFTQLRLIEAGVLETLSKDSRKP